MRSPCHSGPSLQVLVVGSGVGLRRLTTLDSVPLRSGPSWAYERCRDAMKDGGDLQPCLIESCMFQVFTLS